MADIIIVLNHLSPTLEGAGCVIKDLTELGMDVDSVNARLLVPVILDTGL